jgi:hypothetical protein
MKSQRPRPRITLSVEATGDGAVRIGGIRLEESEARALADDIIDAIERNEDTP